MTKKEFYKLPIGLYAIYWKGAAGPSIGSIGVTVDGGRWIAPDNWVLPATDKDIRNDGTRVSWMRDIDRMHLLLRRVKEYNLDGTSYYKLMP